jgi:acyl-CoA dehydrogenase
MASDFAAMAADSLERIVRIHGATAFGPPAGRWQEALATDIQDLQLQLLLVSESRGGASGGWPDAYTVLRLAGRYAIPLPIAEGMLAARILGSAGMAPDPGIFTIATQVNGEWTRAPSGILFTGQLSSVPWGGAADHVLCVASVAGETVVCVLARASAQVSPAHNLAGERRDVLSFKQAPATVARASGTEANSLLDYSALARLAQIAGSLSAALQLSVDYVCQRKQFGQAIAKFQAIQQQLAVFGTEVAAVTCVVQAACAAADTGTAGFRSRRRNCALTGRLE